MIIKARQTDAFVVATLANKLWKHNTVSALYNEFNKIINDENNAIFIYIINEKPIGFAQCSLRHDYVEGTQSSPVGYLEGIYVEEEHRNKGYAKELLKACEQFAIENNTFEFASDCEINNLESLQFHLKLVFDEVNQVRCFTKKLK